MKKRLAFFYVLAAFLVIVIIVLAINKKDEKNQEKVEEEKIQFESGNTIGLYRSQKGQIENVDLNYYLLCVVASEMPFKYEYEALKAQAVVARTYLFNKMKNNHEENGDVCDSFAHCQAFNDIENLEEIWKKKGFTQEEIIEGEEKIKKAIVDGSKQRLRPVFLTTITTVVGLLPTVYGIGGRADLIIPIVMALAYGLLFSSLLTLIFLPCMFMIMFDLRLIKIPETQIPKEEITNTNI